MAPEHSLKQNPPQIPLEIHKLEVEPVSGQATPPHAVARRRKSAAVVRTAASTRPRRHSSKDFATGGNMLTQFGQSMSLSINKIIGGRVVKPSDSNGTRHKDKKNITPGFLMAARRFCLMSTPDITTSSEAMDAIEPCRLLSLPAEIRNEIWKFTVIEPKPLNILKEKPKQPAITQTCRQIRAESIRYFYRGNSFTCTIINYDPANFKRYRKTADRYGLSTVVLTHRHSADATREVLRRNFLGWVEGTFRGETAPLGYSAGHTEDTYHWDKLSHRIVKVFNIAKELRKVKADWEAAKVILLAAIDAAGVCGEKRR